MKSESYCPSCEGTGLHWSPDGDCVSCDGSGRALRGDAAPDVVPMDARLAALLRIARAAQEFRRWDAVGALTHGELGGPDTEDAEKDLAALDGALSAALSLGALAPLPGAEALHQAIAGVIHAARLMAHWKFAPMISDPFVRAVVEREECALRDALRVFDAQPLAGGYAPLTATEESPG